MRKIRYKQTSDFYQSFIYSPTDVLASCLKNNIKIYKKIYNKTFQSCFGVVTASSASALMLSLMMV